MASSIICQEHSQISGQAKIDILLVGDVTVGYLADTIQKLFANIAEVTITISDMKEAAALLDDCTFNMVFLRMPSSLSAEELEAIKLISYQRQIQGWRQDSGFGKKKNTHSLFVFIIPENFKGHGADIALTEPLTMEKMSNVVKYWKTCPSNTVKIENATGPEEPGLPLQRSYGEHLGYFPTDLFACPESLRNGNGLELNASLSEFEKNKKISLLHSSKEKLRRERIKYCCEQLRTLLPNVKGRKNDAASVLEATVDYVKYIREKISPAIMAQITEALQSNRRFCKKQRTPIELSLPGTVMAQRENSVTSTYSPERGLQFLTNMCWNGCSTPDAEGSLDEAVRVPSSSTSENAIGDPYKTHIPSAALSLNSLHTVKYYSKVTSSYNATAVTNQNISIHLPSAVPPVSKLLPQHCTSGLGQTCTTHPNCLRQRDLDECSPRCRVQNYGISVKCSMC
nr:spermatogenesis- and oogenesis-specific basic helix-loop-helix-containing protein 2 isoform X2 [Symphalangus syndactylus]